MYISINFHRCTVIFDQVIKRIEFQVSTGDFYRADRADVPLDMSPE